jgi:anti-sigma factor RsiW
MKTCKDTLAHLLDYLDGDITEDLRARLDKHFGGCQPCEEFLKTYRDTPKLCRKALVKKMPEEVANKLSELLRAEWEKKPQG